MTKSLIHFIDAALLPAALMVVGKFLGLLFTVRIFNLPIALTEVQGSIFSVRPEVLPENLVLISTYSDIAMYLVVAAGFSVVLLQATHFHDTHIKPSLLIKLSNYNLLGLVKSSFNIYHLAAIWLVALWLTSGLVMLNAAVGKTEGWVGITCVFASIIFTSILLQDVYKEIEIARRNLGKYSALS
jgi:hypothetical protein